MAVIIQILLHSRPSSQLLISERNVFDLLVNGKDRSLSSIWTTPGQRAHDYGQVSRFRVT